mgnify:CR=1 FL=1
MKVRSRLILVVMVSVSLTKDSIESTAIKRWIFEEYMLSLLSRSILLAILLTVSFSARAERTDVVFLHNGDRITGEVKSLSRGKLEFKTDHMGTVFIEWDDIRKIISQPISKDASNSDYGVTSSIAYKF